ncbi:hypothetical protein [Vibrio natriegens]|uniref:Uncharacterized protein n=1 Tax=Vibrio natriegens NBRC 15636 = ATCC 14048 = DSM 759 TaxID=1219067 RepID=A0AAN0Y3U8_VIBNA|nr:hypothetical protein [Vibrio natriegens]ALR14787.1 hypothetical protein PN96_01900 [Vibrio natriegens NBRC 15636 = ATCC 14048 = DSM 759]ANQ13349.1 hypothetical protein BA890_11380 [Vibrio natriegens NBRC 15636 = ATCC 14048 = DSM 759]EPM40937.1 hypothetical protein M272_10375 [Vibrio natriegens NBRC 15636 = ATCC 14048 = DSM 759]MDX6027785.1 hypothetical protein [Vibrio natriegens NBRC 15636 = ATCC 14048 = DSM 759]UUI11091.1 hypothetical protein NP431_11500 [Vibrio natriegens]
MNQQSNQRFDTKPYVPLILSITLAVAIFFVRYTGVAEWDLGDNDNFMRLHQVMTFIESPSWYVQPLRDFNPQDGQIIHWSRIPDLPILALYYVSRLFVDHTNALQFSIAIVPLIYLVFFILILCQISREILGIDRHILTIIYTFFSISAIKFYPGYIDHHNLQVLLYSIFILLTFSPNYKEKLYVYGCAISITVSLLIGLEVLPFFIITLALLTIYALYSDLKKLKFIRDISLLTVVSGVIGIMIFQPVSIWFNPQYDILSLPLLCFFLAAAISISLTLLNPRLTVLLLSSFACIGLTWLIFPNVLKSPYSDYPEPLVTYWLSHVLEARPLTTVIKDASELSQIWLYFVTIVPAALSIFLLKNNIKKLYYLLFIISLIPAIFWQVRTIIYSSMLAIPLNLTVGLYLFNIINIPVLRILPPFLIAPALSTIIVLQIEILLGVDDTEKDVKTMSTHEYIKKLDIEGKKILAPMDNGAEIVTLTDNYIIAAPYHRNIRGNLLYVNTLLSDNYHTAYKLLREEGVDLFVFNNNDSQTKYILSGANDKSLVKLLSNNKQPEWLTPISKSYNGIFIYSIN